MAIVFHSTKPDDFTIAVVERIGLTRPGEKIAYFAPGGGVSSDIWVVETDTVMFCIKRALSKLKTAADWFAPVERYKFEIAWMRIANEIVPGIAPKILAVDDEAMLFAMEYLQPTTHVLWKNTLQRGNIDHQAAAECGARLVAVHAGTAHKASVAERFPDNDIFHAIRLEPYLEATASHHPDLHDQLFELSRQTAETKIAMIHGDVSPKNILLGPNGPVFIDAECACIGDPAFDLAFCLNHFLLKCLWVPAKRNEFLASYDALASAYLKGVDWEEARTLEARAARLLPGLFLARIDGKSPVEYINSDKDKDKVRCCARALLLDPPARLADVRTRWAQELRNER